MRGLTKRFGGLLAVNGCNFEVAAGSVVGLIGPNGSGKSTVFNLITNLLHADSGSVLDEYLGNRHLTQYVDLCASMIA